MKSIFFVLIVFSSIFKIALAQNIKPVLNVLAPLGVISHAVVSQFEVTYKINIRVDFVANKLEYDSRFRAGLRNYDIVIADEKILEKLYLSHQTRPITDNNVIKFNASNPLELRSKYNSEGIQYVSLMADPLGIVYFKNSISVLSHKPTWNSLISPNENPFWRQRIYVSDSPKFQFLLALLATRKEITPTSGFIPDQTVKWLQHLRLQSVSIDYPLEFAFLGKKIDAAVVFRSSFVKYKKIIPNLEFSVPLNTTYFNRIGIGIAADTSQEVLSQQFVRFMRDNREKLIVNGNYLSLKTTDFFHSATKNWVLYDEEMPVSKGATSALREIYKK